MQQKECKACGNSFVQYNSLQNLCNDCQVEKSKHVTKKTRRVLSPQGKITKQWLNEDRPKWIKNHPPSHEGYWECYLQLTKNCKQFMTIRTLTLDHIAPRGRYPAKRRKQQNFKPACRSCNELKGPLTIDRIKKLYPQSRVALGEKALP